MKKIALTFAIALVATTLHADLNQDLLKSVLDGYPQPVELLIAQGANVNYIGMDGTTPLECAVRKGYPKIVQMLLNAGANPNTETLSGLKVIHWAVFCDQLEIMQMLASHGADANAIIPKDISAQASQKLRNFHSEFIGMTPLILAVVYEKKNLIPPLIMLGARVNERSLGGLSPLMCAFLAGNLEIMQLLVSCGADVESPDSNGFTLLMHVAPKKRPDIVKNLIKLGANVNAVDPKHGMSVLIYASAVPQNAEVISQLITAGAFVNYRSPDGMSALKAAIDKGGVANMYPLLQAGAKE